MKLLIALALIVVAGGCVKAGEKFFVQEATIGTGGSGSLVIENRWLKFDRCVVAFDTYEEATAACDRLNKEARDE